MFMEMDFIPHEHQMVSHLDANGYEPEERVIHRCELVKTEERKEILIDTTKQ